MRRVVIFLNILVFALCEDILVKIPDGALKGTLEKSWKVPFYAFQQIPFGKPPVGKLRFQPPQPAEKWKGVRDATHGTRVCMQMQNASSSINEAEDCLYLNVYTPERPGVNKSLPVMVYIYGGGFVDGGSFFYGGGPHYLMEGRVVIVTLNYRVGAFGFLATGDKIIPGNYGLKDQVLGLKWVQNNIKYFNGDPKRVTIFGQSAGGASVTFHMMSKQSKGLFRAAISESGSSLCPWSYQRDYKKYAYALANYLNPKFKKNASSQELLQYLQSVSALKLKEAQKTFKETLYNEEIFQGFWFTPVVEPEHEGAFLTELQYQAVEKGHVNNVPLMIGINSEEQIGWASNIDGYKWVVNYFDENVTALVNNNMKIKDHNQLVKAGNAIRKIYSPTTLKNKLSSLVRYFSDTAFNRAIITHAKLHSKFSNVYFYEFSYHGKLGNNNVTLAGADRVGHCEELGYIWCWGNYTNLNTFPAKDVLTSLRLRTLMTNFVKYLNPTPAKAALFENIIWPKVTSNNFHYLNINETLSIRTNPKGDSYPGWVEVYEKYAVKPYDTF